MQNIADDGDDFAFDAAFVTADGEHIQHRLSRVGMAAVTGINNGDVGGDVLGNKVRSAGIGMAHHNISEYMASRVPQRIHRGFALGGS